MKNVKLLKLFCRAVRKQRCQYISLQSNF